MKFSFYIDQCRHRQSIHLNFWGLWSTLGNIHSIFTSCILQQRKYMVTILPIIDKIVKVRVASSKKNFVHNEYNHLVIVLALLNSSNLNHC